MPLTLTLTLTLTLSLALSLTLTVPTRAAEQKTLKTEECAFCGKPGHHHSKCPKRKSTFVMSGVVCAACGNSGHTARDCKGDKSNIVKKHTPGGGLGVGNPSVFEDEDFAAFSAELAWRS